MLLFARVSRFGLARVCWLKQCVLTCSCRAVSMLFNASSGCRQIQAVAIVQVMKEMRVSAVHAKTQDLAFVMYV